MDGTEVGRKTDVINSNADGTLTPEASEDEQLNGDLRQFIENPIEAVCLAAFEDRCRIQFIENPSEALCLAAFQKDGRTIEPHQYFEYNKNC